MLRPAEIVERTFHNVRTAMSGAKERVRDIVTITSQQVMKTESLL